MLAVNLIVSCTNRKKAMVPDELRLRSLTGASSSRRLEQWLGRLATHELPTRRAADLYAGDHWQVARTIPVEATAGGLDIRLWICSAGYGLVRQSDMLKPYSATFAPRHPDSVAASATEEANGSALRDWWAGLSARSTTNGVAHSIGEMAAYEPQVPVILVASEPYLLAMAADLLHAVEALASDDLLSIVSIGAASSQQGILQAHLLPADARFEAVVGGTRAALNVRVARLLFRELPSGSLPSRKFLASKLAVLSADLPPLRQFNRRRLSDAEVLRFIDRERRAEPKVTKTQLLRRLRSSGAACEQVRFSEIFRRAHEDGDAA